MGSVGGGCGRSVLLMRRTNSGLWHYVGLVFRAGRFWSGISSVNGWCFLCLMKFRFL